MDEQIRDVTEFYPHCVKAEQKGRNVLIMSKLDKPIKRFDGKTASYELMYNWLSPDAPICPEDNYGHLDYLCRVSGTDFTYWQKKEFDLNKSFFDQFDLMQ